MKICCLMMQKDEDLLIEHWVHHHASLFGAENLYIFDNGSESERARHLLSQAELLGAHVDYSKSTPQHFKNKGPIIRDAILELEHANKYDFFFPLDCDEFLCAAGPRNSFRFDTESILSCLQPHIQSPATLMISASYLNLPGRPGQYMRMNAKKCFFAANAILDLDRGFHKGTTRHGNAPQATSVAHIHYRFKPYALFLKHARNKLSPTIKDFNAETLAAYRGPGKHLTPYFAMSESEYLEHFMTVNSIAIPEFSQHMLRLGLLAPYS